MSFTAAGSASHDDALRLRLLTVRIVTAIVQGLTLYYLYEAGGPRTWTPAEQIYYVPLSLVAIWIPLLIYFGVGQIPAVPLAVWVLFATVVIAGLGYHSAARETHAYSRSWLLMSSGAASLRFALAVAAFIGHVLVVDTVAERRLVVGYERHFDTAWKAGLQVFLALLFVGVFWLLMYLGARLFLVIKLSFLNDLIAKPIFIYPATALATAIAVHFTDMQASVLRGLRAVVLTLFSWLLPILAVIVFGFLAALPFVSIETLWSTRFAASLLLWSAAALIFLVNATYQDARQSRVKFVFVVVAVLELIPLISLAAWAIALRVGQHGWTTDRIFAAATAAILFCYAAGYVLALARRSAWERSFETANVVTAYAILATILALFTPLADPSRLMVADQVARLKAGVVTGYEFDYRALAQDGARWGKAALEALSETSDVADALKVNELARAALSGQPNRQIRSFPSASLVKLTPELVEVLPAGRSLPDSFFDTEKGAFRKSNPACAQPSSTKKCRASFIASNGTRPEAILFMDSYITRIFEQDPDGRWEATANLQGRTHCRETQAAMAAGELTFAEHAWPDVVAGGERLTIVPVKQGPCK